MLFPLTGTKPKTKTEYDAKDREGRYKLQNLKENINRKQGYFVWQKSHLDQYPERKEEVQIHRQITAFSECLS